MAAYAPQQYCSSKSTPVTVLFTLFTVLFTKTGNICEKNAKTKSACNFSTLPNLYCSTLQTKSFDPNSLHDPVVQKMCHSISRRLHRGCHGNSSAPMSRHLGGNLFWSTIIVTSDIKRGKTPNGMINDMLPSLTLCSM